MWIVAFITVVAVLIFASRMKELKDAREAIAAAGGISSKVSVHGFFQRAENRLYRPVDPGQYYPAFTGIRFRITRPSRWAF